MSDTEYHSYLLIDDLLRLQRPLTAGARDELLFIVVHQVYELWFRIVVDELIHARDALLAAGAHAAVKPLRRVLAVEGLLYDQLGGPSLWEAFCACGRAQGLELPDGDAERERRLAALAGLYRDHAGSAERSVLHSVAELLCDHDEAVASWRFRHSLMAARTIGARPGTGGSAGVEYLRSTVDRRFFPELWEARTRL